MNFWGFFKKIGFSFRQREDWIASHAPTEIFFNLYKNQLKNTTIGCSFSPEYFEEITSNLTPEVRVKALKYIVDMLFIKEIRFGLRWNQIERDKGKWDFSYYKPYLDFLLQADVSVCLNIGPIKTFRWPEHYVPDHILKMLTQIPAIGTIITEKSELGRYAFNHAEQVLKYLKSHYSEAQLKKITSIQIENEPFHKFGKYEWRMSESYILALIKLVQNYLPHAGIMLNSSETKNIKTIATIFQTLRKKGYSNMLISGFNYYYLIPKMLHLPGLGKLDSISKTQISGKNICQYNKNCAETYSYQIEISEAQLEPWHSVVSPGNSAQEFRYLLVRCISHILPQNQRGVIRVWGIEHLVGKALNKTMDHEHKEILDIIKRINSQK